MMTTAKPEGQNLSWGLLKQFQFDHVVSSSYEVVYASLLWGIRGMLMLSRQMQLLKIRWVRIGLEGTCETKPGQDTMSSNNQAIASDLKLWSEDI